MVVQIDFIMIPLFSSDMLSNSTNEDDDQIFELCWPCVPMMAFFVLSVKLVLSNVIMPKPSLIN